MPPLLTIDDTAAVTLVASTDDEQGLEKVVGSGGGSSSDSISSSASTSSTASTSSSSGAPASAMIKRVTYGPEYVYEVPRISEADYREIWFTKDDYGIMRTRDKIIVSMVKKGRFEESDHRTLRGLETRMERRADRERRSKSIKVVMAEQMRQRETGMSNPIRIARTYAIATEDSAKFARLLGQQDTFALDDKSKTNCKGQEQKSATATTIVMQQLSPIKEPKPGLALVIKEDQDVINDSPRRRMMKAWSTRSLFQTREPTLATTGAGEADDQKDTPKSPEKRPSLRRSWSTSLRGNSSAGQSSSSITISDMVIESPVKPMVIQSPTKTKTASSFSPRRRMRGMGGRMTSTRFLASVYQDDNSDEFVTAAGSNENTSSRTATPNIKPDAIRSSPRRRAKMSRMTSTRLLANVYETEDATTSAEGASSSSPENKKTDSSPRRATLRTWSSTRLLPTFSRQSS